MFNFEVKQRLVVDNDAREKFMTIDTKITFFVESSFVVVQLNSTVVKKKANRFHNF